jgi:antirestriction protein ArdC
MKRTVSKKKVARKSAPVQADAQHAPDHDKKTVEQIVTDRIIKMLEAGTVPWRHFASQPLLSPRNFVSKRAYQGINVYMLSFSKYGSPYWLTAKQLKDCGGTPKEGQKADEFVVFWKILEYKDEKSSNPDKKKKIPFLRYSRVYNLDQVEGIKDPTPEQTAKAIAEEKERSQHVTAESVIAGMPNPPKITIDNAPRAYYVPLMDEVHMLDRKHCITDGRYYSTFFHELVHSTGHKDRLNRANAFGSTEAGSYAKEELVAEMGAGMLCHFAGLFEEIAEDSANYIASWLKHLRNDPSLVVAAASRASKAANYIKGEITQS